MSKRRKVFVRIIAIALAVLMAGSILLGVVSSQSAYAVTQGQIDSLKEEKEKIEKQQEELQSQINSLEYEQSTALAKKSVLDEQIALTEEEISNLTAQIEEYNQLIIEKEKEARKLQQQQDERYELYKERIRAMEENGTISYFEILFGARSFSDFISRVDFISEIMSYDEEVYQDYVDAKEATLAAKAEIEDAVEQQEAAKLALQDEQATLEVQVEEANVVIAEIQNNISDYQDQYDEMEAEEKKTQQEIDSLIAELQKQQEEAEAARPSGNGSTGSATGTGSFIWPSTSNYITSLFGTRFHPIFHVYKSHNGVDIGASYGTPVYAADGGTVVTSVYSSSYGNYIVINHGNGMTTLYAHMSQRVVSAGDTVSQGEVIGYVGSTGNSTGPHLHFEMTSGGSRINPLDYFSNYVISPNA